jgi:hypothetical protein
MMNRRAGQTLRKHARFTWHWGIGIAILALVLVLGLLMLALDNLLKALTNHAVPSTAWLLYIALAALLGLMGVVRRIFHLSERAAQGASGEEQVGRALESLRSKGWVILHDLPLPTVGNIDHLIIGPPGVFVVETKSHRGQITAQGMQLLRNGKPLEKDFIRQVKFQSAVINQMLQQKLSQNWYIQPIICFTQAFVQIPGNHIENVWVLPLKWLLSFLERQPARLTPAQVNHLASAIRTLFHQG